MEDIVKNFSELKETLEQSNGYNSQIKSKLEELAAAIVNNNVNYMVYQTNRIKSDETTMEQKQKIGVSLNWRFKDLKPLREVMYNMYPEHKEMFDKRAAKVEEAYQKYLKEKKRNSRKGNSF